MSHISDLPPADHFPHGTRARYVAKCRCDECRRANREYAAKRAKARIRGDWNGLVDASEARNHLLQLSKAGVGRRAVQEVTGIASSVLMQIRSGAKTKIRARTAKSILAVGSDAKSDHALVPAKETWKLVRELLRSGYTKGELAQELGNKTPALQLRKDKVLLRTAHKVKKLHTEVMEGIELEKKLTKICPQCGNSHEEYDRLLTLRKMLPAQFTDIREAHQCLYGSVAGERRLYRDLHKIGAESENAEWTIEYNLL